MKWVSVIKFNILIVVVISAILSYTLSVQQVNAAVIINIEGIGSGEGLKCNFLSDPGSHEVMDAIDIRVGVNGGRVLFEQVHDIGLFFAPIIKVDVTSGPPNVAFRLDGYIQADRGSCGDKNFTITGKCHVGLPKETVTYTSSNNHATWEVLYKSCDAGFGVGGPPSNSGCTLGTENKDNLVGTPNNDCIEGKGGNDKIAGLVGNDKLNGGDGKDLLNGGIGNDELTGGNGADKFDCGSGKDKITDFKPSEGDIKSTNCE
jgi:hypothetical protein